MTTLIKKNNINVKIITIITMNIIMNITIIITIQVIFNKLQEETIVIKANHVGKILKEKVLPGT